MAEQTKPVDVLAEMDRISMELRGAGVHAGRLPAREHRNHLVVWGDEVLRLRAAFAELVEAAERVNALSIQSDAHVALRAALAAVHGGA
jgi:hypothetical protein